MGLRHLHLYWRQPSEDVDLGTAYLDDVPRQGDILAHTTDHGVTWRVIEVYRFLVEEDSLTYQNWASGRGHSAGGAELFVAKTDGPHRRSDE